MVTHNEARTMGLHVSIRRQAAIGLLISGVVAAPAQAVSFSFTEGPATATRNVSLQLDGPPHAVSAVVSGSPRFETAVAAPPRGALAWRIDSTGPDGPRYAWVRYLDSDGAPIDELLRAQINLDRMPPATDRARLVWRGAVRTCRKGGPPVTLQRREAGRVRLTGVSDLSPLADARTRSFVGVPGPWRPLRLFRPGSVVGGPMAIQVRDTAGNRTPWITLTTPAARREIKLSADRRPFAYARHCQGDAGLGKIRSVNRVWRRGGRSLPNRARVKPRGSRLVWTNYSGQGLYPNWVHAGTELNERLRKRKSSAYRAGVAEVLAFSREARTETKRFRVNENLFADPDGGGTVPWRDGMGTAVLLALLEPAIPHGDAYEANLARKTAAEYLATFDVSHRSGGVRWSHRGPGAWYLEYTHRTRNRVLNGFMQSLVSLDRFSRQAGRRAKSDPAWKPLSLRARRLVREGAVSLAFWLPAYDLGKGKTRYALRSGPAAERYRKFHVQLLTQLGGVSYITAGQRKRFTTYAARWRR